MDAGSALFRLWEIEHKVQVILCCEVRVGSKVLSSFEYKVMQS